MNGTQGVLYAMEAALLLIGISMLVALPVREDRQAVEWLKSWRISLESSLEARMLAGALYVTASAFVPPLVYMCYFMFVGALVANPISILGIVFGAVGATSWLVLPTGFAIGALMPRWIGQRRGRAAMGRGMMVGFWFGLVTALGCAVTLDASFLGEPPSAEMVMMLLYQVGYFALVLVPWFVLCIGVWAWRWSAAPSPAMPTDIPM